MNTDEIMELVEQHAAALGEHFDAIQILVTWNDNGNSYSLARGSGNWYARQGLAHEFITKDVAQENARQISQAMQPPDAD